MVAEVLIPVGIMGLIVLMRGRVGLPFFELAVEQAVLSHHSFTFFS